MNKHASMVAAALLFAILWAAAPVDHLAGQAPAAGDQRLFLPLISAVPSPAGVYDCNEYEFGQIWTSEVVTLNPDGSSVYAYPSTFTQVVTGTWVYTPTSQEIQFTHFRWITATVELPDRLFISKYLPQAGFEIGMNCLRRPDALAAEYRRLAYGMIAPG